MSEIHLLYTVRYDGHLFGLGQKFAFYLNDAQLQYVKQLLVVNKTCVGGKPAG